ncbi:MAG: DUF3808 domain-containing protein [Ignavibacteriales bacterium]|nr:DUF3808 domain-containing protein [Ignavibacteriales bacterium]
MKKIVLTFLICSLSLKLFGQSEINNLIKQGLDYSYNFQLEKAEAAFDRIISKNPNDPRGYHYKSSIYLWTYMSNKDKDDYDKFFKFSDIAIEKAQKIIEENAEDETALYVLGANYGFRAMALMKSNSQLSSVWAVKNSNKYLKEVLEKNPKMYDAYLGLGLFNYALSLVPGVFKWALKIAGLSGNREEGINYLKWAYRNGNFSKTEAAYYLSQIYSETLIDYNTSLGYLKQLVKEFPANVLFQYSYAVVLIKSKKPTEAEKILRQIIKINNPNFKQVTAFSNFLVGEIIFRKNNFDSAINYYNKFLSSSTETDYSGIAYYRIAICYELTDRRDEGKKYYILARNGNLDIQDDLYAKRKSEIYFDRTLSDNEISSLKASNLIESGKFKEAFDSLTTLLPKLNSEKLKAEVNLYLSDVCFELGRTQESVEYGIKACSYNVSGETWIKPFAEYYIARAFVKLNNKSEATHYLEKAESSTDYDYQTKLTAFINGLKIKLSI